MQLNNTIKLSKTPALELPNKEILTLIHDFVCFAKEKINIPSEEPVCIKLLHAAPDMPITTGAFSPQDKKICVIVQNRHFIDYARTIAHEMVHLKQLLDNDIHGDIPEIGGPIEDAANAVAGQVMKEFIKTKLTKDHKKFLGLGQF